MLSQVMALDRNEVFLAALVCQQGRSENLCACPLLEIRQAQTAIDGGSYTDEVSVTIPATHPDAQYLAVGNYLLFQDLDGNWQEYHIVLPERLDEATSTITATAEHSFYELLGEWIDDSTATNTTAGAAVSQFISGTRWTLGNAANLGVNTAHAFKCSVLAALAMVASTWGGELYFRLQVAGGVISARYVDILAQRGNVTGKRFETYKDMARVKQTIDIRTLCSALIGRGKSQDINSGNGQRLEFTDIAWSVTNGDPVDKPAGQNWVGDSAVAAAYGPSGRHIFGSVQFDDVTDPADLLQQTYDELQIRKVPLCTYEMDVVTLEGISGLAHEAVRFGDTVQTINCTVNPALTGTARVIVLDRNLIDPTDCKVTLGNYISTLAMDQVQVQRQLSSFSDRAGTWDRSAALSQNTSGAGALAYTLNLLTTQLSATTTNFSTDANGNFIWQNASQSKALMIGSGILAISNFKTNGNYNWTTFATGDGVTATAVQAATGSFSYVIAGTAGSSRLEIGIGQYNEPYLNMYDSNNTLILTLNKTGLIFGASNMARFTIGNRSGIGFFPN